MGVENKYKPSNKKIQQKVWFWPLVYGGIAIFMIAALYTFSELNSDKKGNQTDDVAFVGDKDQSVIPVSQVSETMKYPLKEEKVATATIVQEFYDINAAADLQQNALLVFNQTFTTSEGIAISVQSEPFEVLSAMSGEVTEVLMDPFLGNRIIIKHNDGLETIYSSINDVLVKTGDIVEQGTQIATAGENESNPNAGVHLFFKVKKNGELMNPKLLLAF